MKTSADPDMIFCAAQFIKTLFSLELTVIRNEADAQRFSLQHQFHVKQYPLSSAFLTEQLKNGNPLQIHSLQDAFLIHLEIFFLKGQMVILGPYTNLLLSQADAFRILQKEHLPAESVEDFLSYYDSFPNLSELQIQRIVQAVIQMADPFSESRTFAASPSRSRSGSEAEDPTALNQQYIHRLARRHKLEQDFFEAVKQGNSRTAISNLHSMHQDVAYFKHIGTTLENERVGAAIVRTRVLLAANEVGLSYILSNQLSSENTRLTMSAKSVDEILELKDSMIRNFCREIRAHKNQMHSALCQSIVYYLEHHYSQPIHLDDIAAELNISPSYLTRIFKREYQTTPINYLKHFRIRKAQDLLVYSDKRIQDISSMVGIPDANYFVKQFYSVTNETPSEYRAKRKI